MSRYYVIDLFLFWAILCAFLYTVMSVTMYSYTCVRIYIRISSSFRASIIGPWVSIRVVVVVCTKGRYTVKTYRGVEFVGNGTQEYIMQLLPHGLLTKSLSGSFCGIVRSAPM